MNKNNQHSNKFELIEPKNNNNTNRKPSEYLKFIESIFDFKISKKYPRRSQSAAKQQLDSQDSVLNIQTFNKRKLVINVRFFL
jgi:hypothetical protein